MKGTFKAPFIFLMLRVDDINRKQVFTFNTFVYVCGAFVYVES